MAELASDACVRCGGSLESYGVEKLRTGGSSGGRKLLFGELAEVGEDLIPLELLACTACGSVEFRLPQER